MSTFGQTYDIGGFTLPSTLVEDPYWNDVNVLLIGSEDVSGSTILAAEGGAVTKVGAATGFGSVVDPIHGTVIDMPIGHAGGLQFSREQTIDQWVSDWTFEFWINPYDFPYAYTNLMSTDFDGTQYMMSWFNQNGRLKFQSRNNELDTIESDGFIKKGVWQHIAISCELSTRTVRMFLDGKKQAEEQAWPTSGHTSYWPDHHNSYRMDDPNSTTIFFNTGAVWMAEYGAQSEFPTKMTGFRFTEACRYTEDFDVPYNIQANGDYYIGGVNTASWDTTTTTVGVPGYTPKFGIASAVFDGDGDKLTVAADDSFTFAENEDYTVEGWVKTEQVGTSVIGDSNYNDVVLLLNGEATDSSSAGNDPVGHTITTEGKFGSGYTTDGAGDGIISTTTDSITVEGDFTIEFW